MWATEILIVRVPVQSTYRGELSRRGEPGLQSGVIIIYNIYVECRVDTIYTIYTARSKAYNEKFCIKM